MPPTPPSIALSPRFRIAKVKVIHDGTLSGNDFSIAKLLLKDGQVVLGIRYDISDWSPDPDKGYPTVRGHASWFILPKNFHSVFSLLSDDDLNLDSI